MIDTRYLNYLCTDTVTYETQIHKFLHKDLQKCFLLRSIHQKVAEGRYDLSQGKNKNKTREETQSSVHCC